MERWLPIEDFEGLYEVSDAGRVKSLTRVVVRPRSGQKSALIKIHGRVLRPHPTHWGYNQVTLQKSGVRYTRKISRTVCAAFHGPCAGREVNHKDGNKTNDSAENLEWVTHSENMRHANRTGLRVSRKGIQHHKAKLTEDDVRAIRALRPTHTLKQLAHQFHVDQSMISFICLRKNWTHI